MSRKHHNRVFLTGASGHVGSEVLKELCERHEDFHVIAGVHDFEISPESMKSWHNLQQVKIDGTHVDELTEKLQGCHPNAMFIIPPIEDRVQVTLGYIEAAKAANVSFLLLLSSTASQNEGGLLLAEQYKLMEQSLRDSGITYCILRCELFMENFLADAEDIKKTETFAYNVNPDAKFNPIAVSDIAHAAVSILIHHRGSHHNKVYTLCGPELISMTHIAEIFSKIRKTDVKFVEISDDEAVKLFLERGSPDWLAKGVAEIWASVSAGKFRTVSKDFLNLLQRPPISIDRFLLEINRRLFL